MTELTMGQRIAARRKLLNLSQEALSERLDVSRQSVSKWESDGAIPEVDKLIALSRIYGVSVGWLLGTEEHPTPQSDTLTDGQLKMVEQIVMGYQAPRQKHGVWRWAAAFSCLAALVAVFFFYTQKQNSVLASENAAIQEQISALSQGNAQIRNQIDSMDTVLKTQQQANKLLRTYAPLCHLSDDAERVEITFYFYPKLYQENLTAYLSILNPEAGVSQMLQCKWSQDRYMVHVTLPLADRYQYSFLLVSDTGYQEEILESNTYFSDPLTHSRFYIATDHPKYTQIRNWKTAPISPEQTVYRFNAPVYMPRIQEKTGYIPFREAKAVLLHNGTVIWEGDYAKDFLELYKKEYVACPLTLDLQIDLPALQEGDELILELQATTHTDRSIVTRLDHLLVTQE